MPPNRPPASERSSGGVRRRDPIRVGGGGDSLADGAGADLRGQPRGGRRPTPGSDHSPPRPRHHRDRTVHTAGSGERRRVHRGYLPTRFPATLDPTAAVARTARIGHGVYVNALVSIGAHSQVGCLANLNRSVSIGHHCDVGPFTASGPSATLCGGVTTGIGVFLGAGSVVLPGLTVGSNSIVGAGAVVTRDVPEGVVMVGNPARMVADRSERIDSSACPLCRVPRTR